MFEQPMGKEELARQWLAEFSALLDVDDGADEAALQEALKRAEKLAVSGPELRASMPYLTVDAGLVDTLDRAVKQVPSVAEDLRRRLARYTGQPLARDLDLDQLREKLSQREARTELGVPTEEEVPARLELPGSEPNYAAGGFMLIFGLGWTSFTTLHAVFMIGGMFKVIGFAALFLLLFYAIFFTVGFGMLYAGYQSFGKEEVVFEGFQVTVTRIIFGAKKVKVYSLGPESKAEVGAPNYGMAANTRRNQTTANLGCVAIKDVTGKTRNFMAGQDKEALTVQVNRINAYLRAQKAISL